MSETHEGKGTTFRTSVPVLNWDLSSQESTDEESNANAVKSTEKSAVNLENDSEATYFSPLHGKEGKASDIMFEINVKAQYEGQAPHEKNEAIKGMSPTKCDGMKQVDEFQSSDCLNPEEQCSMIGLESNIDLQIDKLKGLNIGDNNVTYDNEHVALIDEMLYVTAESEIWNDDIISALQDDDPITSNTGVKLKLVRSKSSDVNEEWMSMIISEYESDKTGDVSSIQRENISEVESETVNISDVQTVPSATCNISEVESGSLNTLPRQEANGSFSHINHRGLMNAADSDTCGGSSTQSRTKRKLKSSQHKGAKNILELKRRRCNAHRRLTGVSFSSRISDGCLENCDSSFAKRYKEQNSKNQRSQLRKRLMEIREEVKSCITGDGGEISRPQAHKLMNEVNQLNRKLLDVLHSEKTRATQKREVNEVNQVCDTLQKQLQRIIDFDWGPFSEEQGNSGSASDGSSSSEVYDRSDEERKDDDNQNSQSSSCSASIIVLDQEASPICNSKVHSELHTSNTAVHKFNRRPCPSLKSPRPKHVYFSADKTPTKNSPKKSDHNFNMSPVLRKCSSKKVTYFKPQKALAIARSKTVPGKKVVFNECDVINNNVSRFPEQGSSKLSPKKYDILVHSSPQMQIFNKPKEILPSIALFDTKRNQNDTREQAVLQSNIFIPVTNSQENNPANERILNATETYQISENEYSNPPSSIEVLCENSIPLESHGQSDLLVSQSLLSYQLTHNDKTIPQEDLQSSHMKINSEMHAGETINVVQRSSSSPQLETECTDHYSAVLQKYKSQGAIPKYVILESETQTDFIESQVIKNSEKSDMGTQTSQQENKMCNDQVPCLTEDILAHSYPEPPSIPLTRTDVPLRDRIYYVKYLRLPEECEFIPKSPDLEAFLADINAPWPEDWLKDLDNW